MCWCTHVGAPRECRQPDSRQVCWVTTDRQEECFIRHRKVTLPRLYVPFSESWTWHMSFSPLLSSLSHSDVQLTMRHLDWSQEFLRRNVWNRILKLPDISVILSGLLPWGSDLFPFLKTQCFFLFNPNSKVGPSKDIFDSRRKCSSKSEDFFSQFHYSGFSDEGSPVLNQVLHYIVWLSLYV